MEGEVNVSDAKRSGMSPLSFSHVSKTVDQFVVCIICIHMNSALQHCVITQTCHHY